MDFGGGWKCNGVNRGEESEETTDGDTDSQLHCQISIHK